MTAAMDVARLPSLEEIDSAAELLSPYLVKTPTIRWTGPVAQSLFGDGTEVWLKLELLQVTGSFKPRGALNVALNLPAEARRAGFTAFSSGNHAAAVAYSAKMLGTTAKVVMLRTSNPARVANCHGLGAEILYANDGNEAMEMVSDICRTEGRTLIHPYEGPRTTCGTATLGLELVRQAPQLDAVVTAIGGGGLCSGVGAAIKQANATCEVLAVEPTNADTMRRSFRSGVMEQLDSVKTIADSLAPPRTFPYSASVCRQVVDALELVSDRQIRDAMRLLYRHLKMVLEPGGAAAFAGALGPFRERLSGRRVGVILCGSNIDIATFANHLEYCEETADGN